MQTAFLSTDVCPKFGAVYAWMPGAWYLADMSLEEVMHERERLLRLKKNDLKAYKMERKRWDKAYPGWLLKCNSRVYGDPSASRAFFDKSLAHMTNVGFERNSVAPCLFTLRKPVVWFYENTDEPDRSGVAQVW